MKYIILYLLAIVLANLSSAYFGPSASIVNAFLFIGLDFTARDKLHEIWNGSGLVWKMGVLITIGSVLSWFINRNAGQIAIASMVAFGVAALVDTVIYHSIRDETYFRRVNGSNFFASMTDSLIFPTIAFGGFLPWVTLGQFAAKIAGGALWAYLLSQKHQRTRCQLFGHVWESVDMTHVKCRHCPEVGEHNPYWGT